MVVFYYLKASEICPDKRGGLSWGDNLIEFYYLTTSEIWPDKWGVISWGGNSIEFYYLKVSKIWSDDRDGLSWVVFYYLKTSEIWPYDRDGVWWESPNKRRKLYTVKVIVDNPLTHLKLFRKKTKHVCHVLSTLYN